MSEVKRQNIVEEDDFWIRLGERHKREVKNSVEWYRTGLLLTMNKHIELLSEGMNELQEENHRLKMELRSTKGNLALLRKRYAALKEHLRGAQ